MNSISALCPLLSHYWKMDKCNHTLSGVSGKTDFLVAGTLLEDGRLVSEGSKYRGAVEKKVKVIAEKDLILMVDVVVSGVASGSSDRTSSLPKAQVAIHIPPPAEQQISYKRYDDNGNQIIPGTSTADRRRATGTSEYDLLLRITLSPQVLFHATPRDDKAHEAPPCRPGIETVTSYHSLQKRFLYSSS